MSTESSRHALASLIDRFLDGSVAMWEWDDFISVRIRDPELEKIRRQAAALPEKYPPSQPGHYCGPDGLAELRLTAKMLRQRQI